MKEHKVSIFELTNIVNQPGFIWNLEFEGKHLGCYKGEMISVSKKKTKKEMEAK